MKQHFVDFWSGPIMPPKEMQSKSDEALFPLKQTHTRCFIALVNVGSPGILKQITRMMAQVIFHEGGDEVIPVVVI